MNTKIKLLSFLASAMLLQACGGDMLGTSDSEDYKLIPEEVTEDPTKARPSENAPVLKTSGTAIQLPDGTPVLLRGINLQFGDNPIEQIDGIQAIRETGSNVVRIQLLADTSTANLEAVLNKVVEHNLIAVLSLYDEALHCKEDDEAFTDAVKQVWLTDFLPIIAQDRYQANIMINIASGWGPEAIFDGYSVGYKTYTDNYKAAIRQFRKAGFNVPLVIDAPGCGADFNAFLSNRGKELMAADDKDNLVLSVHGYGSQWNTATKVTDAISQIAAQNIPVLMSEFGGSGVGEKPVKHMAILDKGAGDYAAEIILPWASATDKVAMNVPFSAPINLTNTDVSFDVKLDEAYVTDGQMGVVMYLRDVNGEYANLAWHSASEFPAGEWATKSYAIQNNASFGWASEAFDITAVAKVGVELVANGKLAEVAGSVVIDNLRVAEGSGAVELYSQSFDDDIAGWGVPWTGTVAAHADGALSLTHDNGEIIAQLDGLGGVVDFAQPVVISGRFFVPADYAGSWMYAKFFNNGEAWTEVGITGLTPGEWTEISVETEFPAAATSVGIQIGNIGIADGVTITDSTEPFLLDDFAISGVAANDSFELGTQYMALFDESEDGWAYLSWGASATVEAVDGALNFYPNANDAVRIVLYKTDLSAIDDLDLQDPFTIKTRVLIPDSYTGQAFEFQLFLQDANWQNHFAAKIWNQDELIPGEWMDLVVEVEFPAEFDRAGIPQYLGFDLSSEVALPQDPILIDEIVFEGMVPVEKEVVIIDQVDFFYTNHFTDFAIDYIEGEILEDDILELAYIHQRSEPFSWIAWSWYGNDIENSDWDMTTIVGDSTALTERGEDIVNGKGGIAGN
ncbi:cellulase family glycosylhydrolase [Saccharophagus degradans]|uniref:cellulase family glycosylhydrolase n=1 Tax=Saccharophagus degradans TaxID=86304 RepID=UPI0024782AF7|nr:cellulase family glycosylhydrolase [Saccharophagus degradans]WGO99989.1 cellulase family glycosylhydrolase [Saccharophagus degradans]